MMNYCLVSSRCNSAVNNVIKKMTLSSCNICRLVLRERKNSIIDVQLLSFNSSQQATKTIVINFSERREASVNCTLHGINQFVSLDESEKSLLNAYLLPFFAVVRPINTVLTAPHTRK